MSKTEIQNDRDRKANNAEGGIIPPRRGGINTAKRTRKLYFEGMLR